MSDLEMLVEKDRRDWKSVREVFAPQDLCCGFCQ